MLIVAEPGNDLSNIEDFTNDFQVKLRIYNHSVYIYIPCRRLDGSALGPKECDTRSLQFQGPNY